MFQCNARFCRQEDKSVRNDISSHVYDVRLNLSFVLVLAAFAIFFTPFTATASMVAEWVMPYNGPANSVDIPKDMAVDSAGNVYVTGSRTGSGTGTDMYTIKYDSSGNVVWEALYNGAANISDGGNSIFVDASGNVYVAGYGVENASRGEDYIIIKYDSSGAQQMSMLPV